MQRESKERWTKERMTADLEQVWRENGLTEEPPILSVEKKRELMVRWFQEGKLYSVMGHDELVDYRVVLQKCHENGRKWLKMTKKG